MVLVDKATVNVAFICKQFYASVIAKEVGLRLNNTTKTCNETNNTSKVDTTSTCTEDLNSKFGIDNIVRDSHSLANMYWLPKMDETSVIARFVLMLLHQQFKFFINIPIITTIKVNFLQELIPFGSYNITCNRYHK